MASAARIIGVLLLATSPAFAKCDHACWQQICRASSHAYHTSYQTCMRDENRP